MSQSDWYRELQYI